MSKILSNRWLQGGIAIAAIVIGFFAYNGFSTDVTEASETEASTQEVSASNAENTETTTTTATTTETIDNEVENAVNTNSESDNINTAADETTK